MTIDEIAGHLGGVVEGDGAGELKGLAGVRDAGPGDLTFLANRRYAAAVAEATARLLSRMRASPWSSAMRCEASRTISSGWMK